MKAHFNQLLQILASVVVDLGIDRYQKHGAKCLYTRSIDTLGYTRFPYTESELKRAFLGSYYLISA